MYRLYCVLKDREEPPTDLEIAYASGKKKLSSDTEAEYIKQLESCSENIKKAFEDQQARAGVSETRPFISLLVDKVFDRDHGTRTSSSNS
jgi:hypothetical protein